MYWLSNNRTRGSYELNPWATATHTQLVWMWTVAIGLQWIFGFHELLRRLVVVSMCINQQLIQRASVLIIYRIQHNDSVLHDSKACNNEWLHYNLTESFLLSFGFHHHRMCAVDVFQNRVHWLHRHVWNTRQNKTTITKIKKQTTDNIIIIIIQHLYSAMGSYWDTEALMAPVKTVWTGGFWVCVWKSEEYDRI